MKNLHLKNLTQKPNPLIILKKLNDPKYFNYIYMSKNLINEIELYINSLTFKNNAIEEFINNYLNGLRDNRIAQVMTITNQIITLLYKYKLNKLDIGSKLDIDKVNNDLIKHDIYRSILTNKIEIYFEYINYPDNLNLELTIYTKQEKNKISEISYNYY